MRSSPLPICHAVRQRSPSDRSRENCRLPRFGMPRPGRLVSKCTARGESSRARLLAKRDLNREVGVGLDGNGDQSRIQLQPRIVARTGRLLDLRQRFSRQGPEPLDEPCAVGPTPAEPIRCRRFAAAVWQAVTRARRNGPLPGPIAGPLSPAARRIRTRSTRCLASSAGCRHCSTS